jgi:hypothetical protein
MATVGKYPTVLPVGGLAHKQAVGRVAALHKLLAVAVRAEIVGLALDALGLGRVHRHPNGFGHGLEVGLLARLKA